MVHLFNISMHEATIVALSLNTCVYFQVVCTLFLLVAIQCTSFTLKTSFSALNSKPSLSCFTGKQSLMLC